MRNLPLVSNVRELIARRETIRYLTASGLKAGHRDKVLGQLWHMLDPLLSMLVYYIVFGLLLAQVGRGRDAEFMLYILSGVLIWRFFSRTVNQGASCIRGNRGLIHEINFPKAVFPISVACARMVDLFWGLGVFTAAVLLAGHPLTWHILWLPVLLVLLMLFVLGVTFITALLGAFYADTTNVLEFLLRMMFYLSPIFYYVRLKPGVEHAVMQHNEFAWNIYMSNPVACFFECFRDALLWGQTPQLNLLGYAAAVAVGVCIFGFALFTRSEGHFAKYV